MKPWLGILLLHAFLYSQEARLPVPEEGVQKEAEKTIRTVFKDEYAKKAVADRIAFAKTLHKQAVDTKDDPAARFVLFRESQDIAARAGDIDTAFKAIEEMSKIFETSSVALKNAALAQAGAVARTVDEQRALALAYLGLSEEALLARQFDVAAKASQGAVAAAKKSKDLPLVMKAETQSKGTGAIQEKFEKVKKASENLQASPDSPDANQAVGEFECFILGDWDAGLPKLAKGTDPALKTLAARDLAKPTEVAEQAALGDGWWDRGEKESGHAKATLRKRAAHWYRQAGPKLTGLSKVRVEKRLEDAGHKPDPRAAPPGAPGSIDITALKAKKASVGAGSLTINTNDTGESFNAGGAPCTKYIFAHAPSTLVFDVPAGARFFLATGVRRNARVEGSWKYIVVVDGKPLFESRPLNTYEGFEAEIAVALPAGAKEIQLQIDTCGSDNGDHSIWGFPRFQK